MKPCNDCTKSSNNKFSSCPPRMSDGRMFTDYRPRCIANFAVTGGDLEGNYDLPNSYEYRQFLINNADNIMSKNRQNAYNNNACGPCTNPYNEGTMLNEQNTVKCDANKCSFYSNDVLGLGTGRQYESSNSSASAAQIRFIKTKEEEQKKLEKQENCCWKKDDDMNYFSYDYKISGNNERAQVPSGAPPLSGVIRF